MGTPPVVVTCVMSSSKYTACFSVGCGSMFCTVTRILWLFCLKLFCWTGKLHPGRIMSESTATGRLELLVRKYQLTYLKYVAASTEVVHLS